MIMFEREIDLYQHLKLQIEFATLNINFKYQGQTSEISIRVTVKPWFFQARAFPSLFLGIVLLIVNG